jgi:hypothetical protein
MEVATMPEQETIDGAVEAEIDKIAEEEKHEIPPVEGSFEQLSLDAGGELPTTTSMTLQGGKVSVEGEFAKGEVVKFYVEARVSDVTFSDKWDSKIMAVVGTERKHKAKIQGIHRAQ